MSANSISDILEYLNQSDGVEKTASNSVPAPTSGFDEASAAMKIASKVEQEQFEKMASDAWFMGEVMAEAFHTKLAQLQYDYAEKMAVEMGDDRRAGELMQSVQGDPPMVHQRSEDLKGLVNVAAPVVDFALHQAVTNKVPAPVNPPYEGTPGAAPLMQPPPPPDVQETDMMAPKTGSHGRVDGAALLLDYLRSRG
jgi:hypothetical protein